MARPLSDAIDKSESEKKESFISALSPGVNTKSEYNMSIRSVDDAAHLNQIIRVVDGEERSVSDTEWNDAFEIEST
jgi:hypothetical protein